MTDSMSYSPQWRNRSAIKTADSGFLIYLKQQVTATSLQIARTNCANQEQIRPTYVAIAQQIAMH